MVKVADLVKTLVLLIPVFCLAGLNAAPISQDNSQGQSESARSIQAGKKLYDEGEYQNAIIKYFEALAQSKTQEEKADAYFNLALSYYALGDAARSSDQLKNLFGIQPNRTIDDRFFPSGFIALSNQVNKDVRRPSGATATKETEKKTDVDIQAGAKKETAPAPIGQEALPQTNAPEEKAFAGKRRWSIRFHGALSSIGDGDLNAGLEGIADEWATVDDIFGYNFQGEYLGIHGAAEAGVHLILPVLKNIGIGLGIGYLRASQQSSIQESSTFFPRADKYTFSPKASAVPLEVDLYYILPLNKALTLSLHAGAAYYLASVEANYRIDGNDGGFVAWAMTADGKGFGFHGGIELDLQITNSLSIFTEVFYRRAEIGPLIGTRLLTSNYGYQEQRMGTLYYYETQEFFSKKYFPAIDIADEAPSSQAFKNTREVKIDFSGGSARTGIIVKF